MSRDGRRRVLTAAAVALPLLAAGLAATTTAQANDRRPVAGTRPTWARASADRGKTNDAQRLDARIWLAGKDPKGLDAYAQAVSTPGGPLYRKFLSPADFDRLFGPTDAQKNAVRSWLTSAGLTVDAVNSHYIHVTGRVADAKKAFATDFHDYAAQRTIVRAPAGEATVPASVASAVRTITGLDGAKHVRVHSDTLPPPEQNYWVAQPCEQYYGQKIATEQPKAYGKHQPYAMCGLLPKQLRGAYGATSSGLTGKGATVAIVDAYAAPKMLEVSNIFSKKYGEQPFAKGQYREVLPATFDYTEECGAAGWYGEEALDVTAVHAVAPKAKVVYAGAQNCLDTGLDDAMLNIVDHHLADIVSNSWGDLSEHYTQAMIDAEESIYKQGAIEGIGFYFSTGDCGYEVPGTPCQARYGDYGSTRRQTDMPASDPWVTAVGGTTLAVGKRNDYKFETGWNFTTDSLSADGKKWDPAPPGHYPDNYAGGSGGGTSELFTQPGYQRAVVPSSLSRTLPNGSKAAKPMRVIPDIAAVADSTTGIRYPAWSELPDGTYGYAESRVGGTSLACPVIAGLQALAQQRQGGAPIGFANPAIYLRAGKGLLHDVTDTPLGKNNPVAFVRTNYTNPYLKQGPLVYVLRTTGNYGIPKGDALPAVRGYDSITGVGTPTAKYLLSYRF
ncbi:S53 family peptidase [Actinoallomurus spadix]|uniref:S53 family peptidase n=1 Tax=Actinoallomurus spadix TaxID=79912 RepID=A0ABP3FC04_9ACTN|nr:S53 family peptidase [Actinoallomurus spadix]MCO5991178.1 S53 family peptidase [Actinoallomurus spadix]